MVVTNVDLQVLHTSPSIEQVTQYTQTEVLRGVFSFFNGPDTSRDAVRLLDSALQEQREISLFIVNYRKDGSPFWNLMHVTPNIKDSKLLSWLGLFHNVSGAIDKHGPPAQQEITDESPAILRELLLRAKRSACWSQSTNFRECMATPMAADPLSTWMQPPPLPGMACPAEPYNYVL